MNLLEKHFDTALDTPDGIKKLRELILTLAMQGKLVPQDPNDQPASELLKEIEAEKKKLVKEGKIRKQEPLPPIKPEEIPYSVPKGWEWVRLGELLSVKTGRKDVNITSENGAYPFFSCANKPLKCGTYSFDCEALLIPGNGANVGMVTYYSGKFEAYQRTYVLTDFILCSPYFFKEVFNSKFLKSIEGKQFGSAINYIKIGNLTNFIVPLPPLAEQKWIVEKIDELMALCDLLEAQKSGRDQKRLTVHSVALNKLLSAPDQASFDSAWQFITRHFNELYSVKENVAELRKVILQLAVMGKLVPQDPNDQPASELLKEIEAEKKKLVKDGKIKKQEPLPPVKPEEIPYSLPKGWEWVRLGNVGNAQTGTTPPKNNSLNFGDYIPFIGPGNIKNGKIDYRGEGLSEMGLMSGRLIQANSIMMVCIGGSIGKQAINEVDVTCNQQLNTITPFQGIETKYLYYVMDSGHFQQNVKSLAGGSATPIINKQNWISIVVQVPPLAEQKRIVEKVDQLLVLCDQLENQLGKATQKQSGLLGAVLAGV